MQELAGVICLLANGMAVEPDGISVELFKITHIGDPARRQRLLDIVVCMWRGGKCRSGGEMPSSWYSTQVKKKKKKANRVMQPQGHLAGSARRQDTAEEQARGHSAGRTEWFLTKLFYHRYDVRDSSATGYGAEETDSV